jgi:cysteine-rich repeat protein
MMMQKRVLLFSLMLVSFVFLSSGVIAVSVCEFPGDPTCDPCFINPGDPTCGPCFDGPFGPGCATCGDGIFDDLTEECDDGNNDDGDGCSADCVTEYCGDGIINNGEDCEDGNNCDEGCNFIDPTAPICTIDSLTSSGAFYELFVPITYITEEGSFRIDGTAEDTQTPIDNVQYNRTSPDFSHLFSGADEVDGSFNELFEDWRSDKDDLPYIEGEHTICCRSADEVGNVAVGECKDICVDTQDPVMGELILRGGEDCDGTDAMYINTERNGLSVTPWKAYDVGCAGIDYYVVEVYKNGVLMVTYNQTENSVAVNYSADGVYYFVIWAVDKAGNQGSAATSDSITVDNTNPEVTIDSPTQGTWFNNDFNVEETDTDVNLLSCEYKIANNAGTVVDWTSIDCGANVSVDISEDCPVDGTCRIYKKAKDKACNEADTSKYYYIDTTAPITTKVVGERKYPGRVFEWLGEFFNLHWFVTDTTDLTFDCTDAGIGCDITYFTIYNATGAIVREGNSGSWTFDVTMNLPDGVYNVTYYSVDNLGNTEELQWEIDKVDSEAPVTVRTVSPTYDDGETIWISCEAEENYTCTDSEVGCADTETYMECEDGGIKVYFWRSVDLLGNWEDWKNVTNGLDCDAPIIKVHNPTWSERKKHIERCDQSVVVEIFEDKSGINESTVYAELYEEDGEVPVRTVSLEKAVYTGIDGGDIYEGLMDTQLPAGKYYLVVYASDNVGNEGEVSKEERIQSGIYVEYIDASCVLGVEEGGACDFEFNICIRGDNDVQMWMDKLAEDPGLITPNMLNAEISKNNDTAYVGLAHIYNIFGSQIVDKVSDAETLMLEEGEEINGKTTFDLSLTITPEIAGMIGIGSYDLEYYLESPEDVD